MLGLPSRVQKVLSQVFGFLFVVSSTLFANWIWQKYTSEIDLKTEMVVERSVFHTTIKRVLEESDYNCTAGIGDEKCPFKLEAHQELLSASQVDTLPKNSKDLLRDIIRMGGLCNGGRTGKKANPAMVKSKCLELKDHLMAILAAEEPIKSL